MASSGSSSSAEAAAAAPAGADLVVALTSHNNAGTIAGVIAAITEGLGRHCPGVTTRLLLADAGSNDATRETAREAAGAALEEVTFDRGAELAQMPYHGQPFRAAALRAVLTAAQEAGARACAVIDAGIENVEPAWIERLVVPVASGGYDYATPYYARRPDEGALTRGLVYPMFRALYGARLRQPAALEFACSAALAAHFLEQDFWETDRAAGAGVDLRLAAAAVTGGFRICESALGVRRAVAPTTRPDLGSTVAQVVGTLFTDLEAHVEIWQRMRGSVAVPVIGEAPPPPVEASRISADSLAESFRLGYRELREIWTWVLPPRTIVELRRLTEASAGAFRFDDRLWAGIVYDFAIGHALRVMPRDHLLRSLTPLYSGWLAAFVREWGDAPAERIDEAGERLCLAFEQEKRYLISRWRWPERFR
jgi:hypothetical protein